MLYPGHDEDTKRRAFAAQYLAERIRIFHERGGTLPYNHLIRIATDAGARLDDLDARWWEGTTIGQVFKTLFALFNTDPELATWEKAILIAQRVAAKEGASGSRSALWKARTHYLSVVHLWGAWAIREGTFAPSPDVDYDEWADFQSFLAESEILRRWGQTWRPTRAKAEPLLPADVWRVPDDWEPPARQPGWPKTGQIPDIVIPDNVLSELRKAGRPRKQR
jgi:hypothetical protein